MHDSSASNCYYYTRHFYRIFLPLNNLKITLHRVDSWVQLINQRCKYVVFGVLSWWFLRHFAAWFFSTRMSTSVFLFINLVWLRLQSYYFSTDWVPSYWEDATIKTKSCPYILLSVTVKLIKKCFSRFPLFLLL